jgi:hypothetical protein
MVASVLPTGAAVRGRIRQPRRAAASASVRLVLASGRLQGRAKTSSRLMTRIADHVIAATGYRVDLRRLKSSILRS